MTEDDTHVELVHQYLVTVIYIEIYDPETSPTAALPKLSVHINLHQPSFLQCHSIKPISRHDGEPK